jgi:dihydroxy-acid dehydratase
MIELDLAGRRLHLDVPPEELKRRRAAWQAPAAHDSRGYTRLFLDHVQGADRGVDLDILVGGSGPGATYATDAQANAQR